nr:lys 63 specific deubiquitinase BRCC36 [Hymenolepis microstoma]
MDEIKLSPSVYQTIVTHALTHEKEEIIGLLLAEECESHIQIYAAKPFPRIVHQPDRVEMSEADLARGIEEADKLKAILGKNITVLGWYHSHPHITVHPSAVDIGTQARYESFNRKFFGIIVSVFDKENGGGESEKQQEIKITSFRSDGEASTKLTIEPIQLDPSTKSKLFQIDVENWSSIPGVLLEEVESEIVYDKIGKINQLCTITAFPMATSCKALNEKLQAQ